MALQGETVARNFLIYDSDNLLVLHTPLYVFPTIPTNTLKEIMKFTKEYFKKLQDIMEIYRVNNIT
jgi:hypothetical protein